MNNFNWDNLGLGIILIIWLIFTMILAFSMIGWIILLPQPNNTACYMEIEGRRSTWMLIGLDIKDKILK